MSEQYIVDFERALENFKTRWGQEKGNVQGVSGKLKQLRDELNDVEGRVKLARVELAKVLSTIDDHKKRMDEREGELREKSQMLSSLEGNREEEFKRRKRELEAQQGVLDVKLKEVAAEGAALRKQKEAMRSLVG